MSTPLYYVQRNIKFFSGTATSIHLSDVLNRLCSQARITWTVWKEQSIKLFVADVMVPGHKLHFSTSLPFKREKFVKSMYYKLLCKKYFTRCKYDSYSFFFFTLMRFLIMLCLMPQSNANILCGFPLPNILTSCENRREKSSITPITVPACHVCVLKIQTK